MNPQQQFEAVRRAYLVCRTGVGHIRPRREEVDVKATPEVAARAVDYFDLPIDDVGRVAVHV